MKYIIGNWKANKNMAEVNQWLEEFMKLDLSIFKDKVTLIICPPFPFCPVVKWRVKDFPFIKMGAQDISAFESGTYTGEVAANSLVGLVDYVIVGHSERRKHNKETDEMILNKFHMARKYNIEPIFCIRNQNDLFPKEVAFLAYEPPESISTGDGKGNTASLEAVLKMKQALSLDSSIKFIYGASVNPENAAEFLKNDEIDGVLPGGASLDPQQFFQIAKSAL